MSRLLATMVIVVALVGCGDDDSSAPPSTTEQAAITTTSRAVQAGDITVPVVDGTFPVPVPSLGFGVALPAQWQATLLSEEALAEVEAAALDQPFFLESARRVAETGAVLYAAGIDAQGRVAELKVDVQQGADTDTEAVRDFADGVVASGALGDEASVRVGDDGLVRIVYRAQETSADDGAPIETVGSQIFVPDAEDRRLWSVIITAEDPVTLAGLVDLVEATFVVD